MDNVGTTTITPTESTGQLILGKGDPYISDPISDLVGRSYRTASFSWTDTDSLGGEIYRLALPEAFLTFPFIKDRLKNYRYFRCTARVSMRMNTTKYQYGSLMVSYIPFYDTTGENACRHLTIAQASQNNGMIFSANVGNTLEFEMPFVSPLTWWDTTTVGTAGWGGLLGTLFVHVLNPLASASPSPPSAVEVSVFIQMRDAEVAGLLPSTTPPMEAVVGQSMPGNVKEARSKAQSGVLVGVKKAVGTIVPVVEDVAKAADSVMGVLGLLGLDKPGTVATTTAYYPDPDADLLYGMGVDYSRKLTFSPSAQTAKSDLIIGAEANPGLYETMQKPFFWRRFVFDSNKVTDDLLFAFIVCPGMITKSTSGANQIVNIGPLAWYASQFAFYRGGIKVLMHFNTSAFTTTRVRISHVQADTINPALMASYSGDFTSRVVDITGDTFVSFVVPYLDPKTFMRYDWAFPSDTPIDHLGTIGVTLVNPVTCPDMSVVPNVSCSIFISAAEDFEVAQFTGQRNPLIDNWTMLTGNALPTAEAVTGQTSLRKEFTKPFDGLTPATLTKQYGLITQDGVTSVTDLGKRYFPWSITTATRNVLPTAIGGDYLDYLAAPFLFNRGSMRIKWMLPSAALSTVSSYTPGVGNTGGTSAATVGAVFAGSDIGKPIGGAEVPYFQSYPFYEFAGTHGAVEEDDCVAIPPTASVDGKLWRAYGDDFSLGYQAACPIWYYPTPPLSGAAKKRTH